MLAYEKSDAGRVEVWMKKEKERCGEIKLQAWERRFVTLHNDHALVTNANTLSFAHSPKLVNKMTMEQLNNININVHARNINPTWRYLTFIALGSSGP